MRQKNTIGSTNKVKNTLKQEIYHFYFHFTHILEISRFEVPISRFFWAFLQGLQICTFWRLAGLLLSRQIISFVHRGYFSEHQVKTCLKNTSPPKCSEILTIPGVHLVILPLRSSPDWVFLHRSRCGDRKFPSTLYKNNTVRNHCIFADWSF